MTPAEALGNLEIAAQAFQGTRQQHQALIEAVNTLKTAIEPAELDPRTRRPIAEVVNEKN